MLASKSLLGGARAAAICGLGIAALVLLGWVFNISAIETLGPLWVPSSPNSALALLLCCISILLHSAGGRWRSMAPVAAALALLLGLLGLGEHLFGIRLLLSRDALELGGRFTAAFPLRGMSFATAICSSLAGALLLQHKDWPAGRRIEPLIHLLGILAVYTPLGYLFGVKTYAGFTGSLMMSIYSGLGFLLVYIGILLLRGRHGALGVLLSSRIGSRAARLLLPVVFAVPFLCAWLRLAAETQGRLGTREAAVATAMLNAVVIAALLLWTCRQLNLADQQRSEQQAALQRSEESLRQVLDAPLLGVAYWRKDGSIYKANRMFLELLRYAPQDVETGSLSWARLQPPEVEFDAHRERRLKEMAQAGRAVPYEQELLRKDGSRQPAMLASMLLDPSADMGVTFLLDMTEKRRSQDLVEERNAELEQLNNELARSEGRLRSVFESPVVGIGYWNIGAAITEANDRMLDILGYSREDFDAGRVKLEMLPPPGQPVIVPDRIEELLEKGQLQPVERELQRSDGSLVGVLIGTVLLEKDNLACASLMLDITEQRRARDTIEERNAELEQLNDELAASEERLQQIFDSPLIGIMQLRTDGSILNANRQLLAMLGYTDEDLQSGRLNLYGITPPDSHADIRNKWQDVLAQERVTPFERVYIRKDGSRLPVLVGVRMLDREKLEAISYVLDITENLAARRKLEEQSAELARSAEKLRRVFQAPLVGTSIFTLDGRVIDANKTFLDMLGYDEADLEKQSIEWAGFVEPSQNEEQRQFRKAREEKLLSEGYVEPYEREFIRKDGSRLTVLGGAAMLDKEQGEAVSFIIDVTEARQNRTIIEQRNAELQRRTGEVERLAADLRTRNALLEQLREAGQQANLSLSQANLALERLNAELQRNEFRLRQLFESSLFAVFYWRRPDVTVTQANRRFLELFGYSDEEIAEGKVSWGKLWPADEQTAEFRAQRISTLDQTGGTPPTEHELLRADGSRLPVLMASVLLDAASQEGATFVLDNTAQRRSREQLEERNNELRRVNEELDAFSYSVSHDLRAPLRAIAGFSQALEEDYREELSGQAQDYLERIQSAARRMGGLIDDLLGLARISRAGLNKLPVDLSALAGEVVQTLREQHPGQAVEFVCAAGLVCEADPRLLRVALENLLGNAWKYSSKQAGARVEFGSELDESGRRAFFVRDNGAGFDEKYVDRLFTPFQRLHTAAEFEGSGIGLATVKRIISRHSGKIWAKGKLGEGASIYFQLESG